ncbi:MAG: hypothetical protein ACJA0C_001161, partial [Candidatus Endobugula sp.]
MQLTIQSFGGYDVTDEKFSKENRFYAL